MLPPKIKAWLICRSFTFAHLAILSVAFGLTFLGASAAKSSPGVLSIEYTFPATGSAHIRQAIRPILRASSVLDQSDVAALRVSALGSISGAHTGKLILTDNRRTLIFSPSTPFAVGEQVSLSCMQESADRALPLCAVNFTISKISDSLAARLRAPSEYNSSSSAPPDLGDSAVSLRVIFDEGASKGALFLAPFGSADAGSVNTLMISSNSGEKLVSQRLQTLGADFKRQNNLLTYYNGSPAELAAGEVFIACDTLMHRVREYSCGNGYSTDAHDLQILPNGHALLISYDPDTINMRVLMRDMTYDTAVLVYGGVIQELDDAHNVVFQWQSWEAIPITESSHQDLHSPVIDYVHLNSVEPDADGNLILSARHLDQVIKVNRQTGKIIWRLGGKHDDFYWPNDPERFSFQHDARRQPSGLLTVFDNGNNKLSSSSRVVELRLDETERIATKVWEYRHNPPIKSIAAGNAQRLSNGNTLIGWGLNQQSLAVTEVSPAGVAVFDAYLPNGFTSYRAYRQEWNPPVSAVTAIEPTVTLVRAYPNPAREFSALSVYCARAGFGTVSLADALGRDCGLAFSGYLRAGENQIPVDLRELASGLISYRVDMDSGSYFGRMLVNR